MIMVGAECRSSSNSPRFGGAGGWLGARVRAGGGYVSEIRMQVGPGFFPGEHFEVADLVAAIDAGQVMLPERDLLYVNAYGPTAKSL